MHNEENSNLNAFSEEEENYDKTLIPNDKIKNYSISNSPLIAKKTADNLENCEKSLLLQRNKKAILDELNKDQTVLSSKFLFAFGVYIILLIVSLLKGSNYFTSVIGVRRYSYLKTSCSVSYWVIYISYLPITIGLTFLSKKIVKSEYEYRKCINFPYHHNDIQWSTKIFILYPLYGLIGGMLAGLLGIGGGLILGPMLLDLGIDPLVISFLTNKVSTATSNFLVLFTSSSTSIQFLLMGMMNLNYGLFLMIFSTIGSCLGTLIIQKMVEKTGRTSLLIFSLAIVLCVSTIIIPIHTLTQTVEKLKSGINIWQFKNPC